MSKNRVLLSVLSVVAIVSMASETATAQLFKGRLLGRRSNACCAPAPAPAPSCCGAVAAPAPVATPCCGQAAPAPAAAPCCGGVAMAQQPAPVSVASPVMVAAPVTSSCCGGSQMVYGNVMPQGTVMGGSVMGGTVMGETLPMEQGVIVGSETILESSETVQASPSDSVVAEETVESTVTSDVVEPPAAAEGSDIAPEEEN